MVQRSGLDDICSRQRCGNVTAWDSTGYKNTGTKPHFPSSAAPTSGWGVLHRTICQLAIVLHHGQITSLEARPALRLPGW